MSSDLLVDLHDELGGDDSPSAALDQLKLVPEKQWPQDDPVSGSKSGERQSQHRFQPFFLCVVLFWFGLVFFFLPDLFSCIVELQQIAAVQRLALPP